MMTVTLGHSPDPDDAFMFYGMVTGRIDTHPIHYNYRLHDIQTLNELLLRGKLDVSAVSVHAYAYLTRRYAILTVGASVGDGYGPIVVAKGRASLDDLHRFPIAVPGTLTTAFLTLRLCLGLFPFTVLPFDGIMEAVLKGEVPFGLLIHEGQLTYRDFGLVKVIDLGEWWSDQTGLPLPLGINVLYKGLPEWVRRAVTDQFQASIRYALENWKEACAYAMRFGRGLDERRTDAFIRMYVNEWTMDLGEKGKRAIIALLERAAQAGLVPHVCPEFYPP